MQLLATDDLAKSPVTVLEAVQMIYSTSSIRASFYYITYTIKINNHQNITYHASIKEKKKKKKTSSSIKKHHQYQASSNRTAPQHQTIEQSVTKSKKKTKKKNRQPISPAHSSPTPCSVQTPCGGVIIDMAIPRSLAVTFHGMPLSRLRSALRVLDITVQMELLDDSAKSGCDNKSN